MSTIGPIFIICELAILGYIGWCCNESKGNSIVVGRYILIFLAGLMLGLTAGVILITREYL